ncbi:ribonuclease III [bacterium]|nr:ribonuclease III [bacterium]
MDSLCRAIKYEFHDSALLEQAMTHRSSLDKIKKTFSNERLEFLGDAVLGWIVTDALYRQFPECNEGELTITKSSIVSRENLARQAHQIQLGLYLILGTGEEQSGGRLRRSILANAYEALLGAVYLDGGVESVRRLIQDHLLNNVKQLMSSKFHHNYKSWLLEHLQAIHKKSPKYHIVKEKGPDHHKEFTVEVIFNDQVLGKGQGNSKKRAEQAAARDALQNLGLLSIVKEEQ